eukprot:TRINITY_DN24802_c0_g1_i1.p1 TRINITY_DN24802_c0_g1~~TRINITY_DN24802_c0_g1_i1.p1  ORF type:complete len:214 (-),score=39.36 TRINITY_DN24802_c0_g1_i1:220-861(-)
MNTDAITLLIESNRYNLEILPQLEQYVQYQVDKQSYHFEANLTVLKFYQFHTEKTQKVIIGKILLKALMNLPSADFSLCMYLIAERLHTEEPIKTLTTLAHLLESARFADFWTEANNCRELLNTIPGFDDAIRGFIISLITSTYQTIAKDTLSEVLNVRGSELEALMNSRGWKLADDFVSFSKSDESNLPKSTKRSDHTRVEELPRVLQSLRY